jgi:hypothetical protein
MNAIVLMHMYCIGLFSPEQYAKINVEEWNMKALDKIEEANFKKAELAREESAESKNPSNFPQAN